MMRAIPFVRSVVLPYNNSSTPKGERNIKMPTPEILAPVGGEEQLAKRGYDPAFGARPLRQII